MNIEFVDQNRKDFDPELYIRILISILKADRENGIVEFDFVKRRADYLSLDMSEFWDTTEKNFSVASMAISRFTALSIIKDCVFLASLDGSYSLGEKEKVYSYAEKMDITRTDVDKLEEFVNNYKQLHAKWELLVDDIS